MWEDGIGGQKKREMKPQPPTTQFVQGKGGGKKTKLRKVGGSQRGEVNPTHKTNDHIGWGGGGGEKEGRLNLGESKEDAKKSQGLEDWTWGKKKLGKGNQEIRCGGK